MNKKKMNMIFKKKNGERIENSQIKYRYERRKLHTNLK